MGQCCCDHDTSPVTCSSSGQPLWLSEGNSADTLAVKTESLGDSVSGWVLLGALLAGGLGDHFQLSVLLAVWAPLRTTRAGDCVWRD